MASRAIAGPVGQCNRRSLFGRNGLVLAELCYIGGAMRRTRILCLIGSLLTIPHVALADPPAAAPSIKAPAPIEVKREAAPAAAPAPAALPAPAPEQKAAAPEAKDKKGADKKAAGKKEKEKKPKVLAK